MRLGRDSFTKVLIMKPTRVSLLSIVGGFMDYTLPAWNHDARLKESSAGPADAIFINGNIYVGAESLPERATSPGAIREDIPALRRLP